MATAEIIEANIAQFGEEVTLTPPGGDAVTISMGWVDDQPNEEEETDGRRQIRRATGTVLVSDLAQPLRTTAVTRDGENWIVESFQRIAAVAWALRLKRTDPVLKGSTAQRKRL